MANLSGVIQQLREERIRTQSQLDRLLFQSKDYLQV